MKAVCDTSPIVWLNRAGRLEILTKVYSCLYTTPQVLEEVRTFHVREEFVEHYLHLPEKLLVEQERFQKLVRRWGRKLRLEDVADVEVYVVWKEYSDCAEEMLFANKEAKAKIGKRGVVRDIGELYIIAEQEKVFNPDDSIHYVEDLIKVNYRVPTMQKILKKLGRRQP